jgi:hypothetical protein
MADWPGSDRCQLATDLDDWSDPDAVFFEACGEPAIAVITFACVHEHVDSPSVCTTCAAEIQRLDPDLICRKCEVGPESHQCPQVIRIRWLADAAVTP